ncbi:MAG: C40 family peptidase [Gemmatimonadaceae bacterium]|nr:C40 family peptidase [Gemmatimonadaceae bacterium]
MPTIRAALAPLNAEARVSSPLTSQLLHGEVVEMLDASGDWLRVRGPDAYEGWLHRGYVMPSTGSEATWRLSLGCVTRGVTGIVRALPFGARVAPGDEVVSGEVIDAAAQRARFPQTASAIVATALGYFSGAPYVWGGVSPWGVDCSGLVQRAFGAHGVRLPRDAWQQAEAIHATPASSLEGLAMGELVFFSDRDDRRITHVAIGTGDGGFVHSSLARGGVCAERAVEGDAYVERLAGQVVARGVVG